MLTFSLIKNEEEIDAFANGFANYVGVKLSISYLKQGKVFGAFDSCGKLVGGYAAITEPKLRSLAFLPDHVKEQSNFLKTVPESMLMEMNALWLSKSVTSRRDWFSFYRQVVKDTVACNKPYIIIYYNSLIPYLAKWYSYIGATQIFKGAPKIEPGQSTHSELYIGYVSRARFSLWLWVASFFIVKKLVSGRERGVEPKFVKTLTS